MIPEPQQNKSYPERDIALLSLQVKLTSIFYLIISDGIEIVRVLNGARDIDPQFRPQE